MDFDFTTETITPDTTSAITINGQLEVTGLLSTSISAAVSASGTTQLAATLLTHTVSVITSSSGSATGVLLPGTSDILSGTQFIVVNASTNAIVVYPPVGGKIDGGAANAAMVIPVNANVTIVATTANGTSWRSTNKAIVAGTNITLTENQGTTTINSTSSGGSLTIKEEGTDIATAASSINFVGTSITATAIGNDVTVTAVAGSGSPGGSSSQVQYNNNGSFAGASNVVVSNGALGLVSTSSSTPVSNTLQMAATTDDSFIRLDITDPNGETIRLARDQYFTVRNNSGSTISKGSWVYVTGASTQRTNVNLASASSDSTMPAVGMMMDTTSNGSFGRCCIGGIVSGIDTSGFTDGDRVFLSTTPGQISAAAPVSGFKQRVGFIINANSVNGIILVQPVGTSPRQDLSGHLWIQEENGVQPTSPAYGNVIFSRDIASRNIPAFVGPNGLDSSLQPLLARNKIGYWNPQGNATTVPGVFGFTAPVAIGTATTRSCAVTNILTRIRRLGYVSATTAGSLCGHYINAAQYTTGTGTGLGGFTYIIRFGTSDAAAVSGARAFIGISSSTAVATNVEPSTLTNCIGVAQISTDNTQWYLVYGGSAAQTRIALGTSLGAPTLNNTAYELALFSSPTVNATVGYQVTNIGTGKTVSGTLAGTPGTTVPASTTLLAHRAWRTNNTTALACGIDICSIYIETDQ